MQRLEHSAEQSLLVEGLRRYCLLDTKKLCRCQYARRHMTRYSLIQLPRWNRGICLHPNLEAPGPRTQQSLSTKADSPMAV